MSLIVRVFNLDRTKQTDLDLYGDESVNLQVSFSEIQDITTRNSAYTKSFDLPGSKKNNDFFNNYYDVDSIGLDFDVNKKYPCDLLFNGYEVMTGNLRLNSVSITGTEKIYSVTFYNQIGDLASNIADKLLCELDVSDLTHTFNLDNVTTSWDLDYLGDTNPPTYAHNGLLDGKVIYPMLHLGYSYKKITGGIAINEEVTPSFDFSGSLGTFSNVDTPMSIDYFKLAVQVKDIYEKIVNQSGYKIESEFFNSPYFKRYYYPLTDSKEGFGLNQATAPDEYFWEVLLTTNVEPSSATPTPVVFDTISYDNGTLWLDNQRHQYPVAGTYTHNIYYSVSNVLPSSPSDIDAYYSIYLNEYDSSNNYIGTVWSDTGLLLLGQSSQVSFSYNITLNQSQVGITPTDHYYQFEIYSDNDLGYGGVEFKDLFVKQVEAPTSVVGQDIDVSKEFSCDNKQVDFIQSINKWFNLVVVPKPNEEDVLIIEPYTNWVGSGNEYDWTKKLNRDKTITIEPTNKIVPTSVLFDVAQSKDFYNTEYQKTNTFKFGSKKQNYTTDFKSNEETIAGIFGVSQDLLIQSSEGKRTLPIFYQTKDEELDAGDVFTKLVSYKTIPKLIYYSGFRKREGLSTDSFYVKDDITTTQIYDWPQFNLITTYPNVPVLNYGTVSNPIFKTYSRHITFDKYSTQYGTPPPLTIFNGDSAAQYLQDSYELFYEQYLTNLHNTESRLVTGEIYLTPEDVKRLDFSERIRIDNSIYVINNISDYDLTKPSVAKVELLKLVDDYQPFNEFYFRFVPCDELGPTGQPIPGADESNWYYTSTAYTDWVMYLNDTGGLTTYIKIEGVCYKVSSRKYEPGKPYGFIPAPDLDIDGEIEFYSNCVDCNSSTTTTTTTEAPPPQYYYYAVEECDTPEGVWYLQLTYPLSAGAVSISINPEGCYRVIGPVAPIAPTATLLQEFSDCAECAGTTECFTWTITPPTLSGESITVEYINCNTGLADSVTRYWNQSPINICAIGTPVADNQGLSGPHGVC